MWLGGEVSRNPTLSWGAGQCWGEPGKELPRTLFISLHFSRAPNQQNACFYSLSPKPPQKSYFWTLDPHGEQKPHLLRDCKLERPGGHQGWRRRRINSQGLRLMGKFRHSPRTAAVLSPENPRARAVSLGAVRVTAVLSTGQGHRVDSEV